MSKKILVVDDSQTVRTLVSFILKSHGFEVQTAINGVDALEQIYRESFDLIVSDINMPKMDGLTLIKVLRLQEMYKELPIIVVTTEEDEQDKEKGYQAGANVYLIKPTDPNKLIANVQMLLSV
ncbi:MAG: response regulator [Candidatus Auribacterota bacterium]|jgi:two-component system chemotaxis response regulator CheY|uniref:Response regulator n=1 Tax=Candidatus Auribacter fodinae TaxID=2093366 RepID=A0A3A4R403_9BACT|nr:MAG: response regulator [Candidatus Auribacter fodinae]